MADETALTMARANLRHAEVTSDQLISGVDPDVFEEMIDEKRTAIEIGQLYATISIAESLERLASCVAYGQSGGPRFRST